MVVITEFYFVARSLHPQSRYSAKRKFWYRLGGDVVRWCKALNNLFSYFGYGKKR